MSSHVTTHHQETGCHDKWCDEPASHVEEGPEDGAQGEAEAERGVHQGVDFARTVWEAEIDCEENQNKVISFHLASKSDNIAVHRAAPPTPASILKK